MPPQRREAFSKTESNGMIQAAPLIFSRAAFSAQSSMDKYTMSDKSRPPSYMGWS